MKGSELIESTYKEAVLGLNELILKEPYPTWYKYIMNLPLPQRLTYMVVVFYNQVFNGGLHQYFFNSYGQFAYETVDYLRIIKAYSQADILNKAIQQLSIEETDIESFRAKIANRKLISIVSFEEKTGDYLDSLDIEWYACDENLEELLINFLDSINTCL